MEYKQIACNHFKQSTGLRHGTCIAEYITYHPFCQLADLLAEYNIVIISRPK